MRLALNDSLLSEGSFWHTYTNNFFMKCRNHLQKAVLKECRPVLINSFFSLEELCLQVCLKANLCFYQRSAFLYIKRLQEWCHFMPGMSYHFKHAAAQGIYKRMLVWKTSLKPCIGLWMLGEMQNCWVMPLECLQGRNEKNEKNEQVEQKQKLQNIRIHLGLW